MEKTNPTSKSPIIDFYSWKSPDIFRYQKIETHCSTEEELWSLLDMVANVKEYRKNLLLQNGLTAKQIKVCEKNVKSFIKQGKNYWLGARKVENPSNALLYYYSFLNLVKAYLASKNLLILTEDVFHGISSKNDFESGQLLSKKVKINVSNTKNVFTNYYHKSLNSCYFNINKKEHTVKLDELFRYCEDIALEYTAVSNKSLKVSNFSIVSNKKRNGKACLVFSVSPDFKLGKIRDAQKYLKTFQLVKYRYNIDLEVLKAFPEMEEGHLDLFISNEFEEKDYKLHIEKFENTFKEYIGPIHNTKNCTGNFYLPCKITNKSKSSEIPLLEEHAIYLLTFFLSEMVRYRPNYLDQISEKKEAWLINAFLNNSPISFLKSITNRILTQNFLVKQS